MSKNLFEVNGITYTDNIPSNMFIGVTKEQFCEYEQLKEENKQLKAKIDKAKHYIYFHSTQRKMFANVSDRFHNQKIQFKGRIEDLLEILGDKE